MPPSATVWVFDLDNTLHDAEPHIFPHINRAMTAYVAESLGLPEAEASELRARYWRRYGATLLGLMKHHGTSPRHFLWHTHQFSDLAPMVVRERQLRHALKRLPGRKAIFSNGPTHYSRAVLGVLGIADLFDEVFCIEHTRFRPKPHPAGFLRLLKRLRAAPERCIMVEDTLANLKTAKALGMRTVWVADAPGRPAFVDVRVGSVTRLPRLAHRLGA